MSTGYQPLMNDAHRGRLEALVRKLGIINLVETGTGPHSSGLAFAKHMNLRGYSCDVNPECVAQARHLYPSFTVHHGESLGFFAQMLPKLKGPTFFWLDGHCPTDQRDLPGPVFPPFEEMALIKALKANYELDAMWIDDIGMITAPDNPESGLWGGYLGGSGTWFYGSDEHSWAEYHEVFAGTHTYLVHNGVLEIEPK